ncbi:unnamed protein product [Linum tenue]|uniref:Alpha/beta hydrolase fold-3 domain-containing protein n=1 Tax=Linum tenue TaxID=586396 RepID=A0AAV0IY96_9ROSI|nr:unnamed protein product [Linum tenue]
MAVVDDQSVIHKDCLFDETHDLRLRLYKPTTSPPPPGREKLPVLFYFHGGGFVVGSREWPNCHNTCQRLASGLQAVVVAPDYRLAPEHRLPAAVDDGVAAVKWLQSKAVEEGEEWLSSVDLDRVYVLGDSSGGNMAHHLAVGLGAGSTGFDPVRVRGYILLAPFFGGIVRTESEEGPAEKLLRPSTFMKCHFYSICGPYGHINSFFHFTTYHFHFLYIHEIHYLFHMVGPAYFITTNTNIISPNPHKTTHTKENKKST